MPVIKFTKEKKEIEVPAGSNLRKEAIKLDGQREDGTPAAKFRPDALTNDGHDFLDTIRNDTIWNQTKEVVAENVGTTALEIMLETAKGIAKGIIVSGGI